MKTKIAEGIRHCLEGLGDIPEFELTETKTTEHGDYTCNLAFLLSKKLKRAPYEIALEVANKLNSLYFVNKVEAVKPGFINLFLKDEFIADNITPNFEVDNLRGKTIVVEHTSPNPNKAMTIGHLRNNVTGMAIANIFEFCGANVIRDCVDNNRGIAIAKLMWGYLKFARKDGEVVDNDKVNIEEWFNNQEKWQTPEDRNIRSDRFVDELYVKASEDFKNEDVERIVRNFVVEWEAENPIHWALWEKVLSYSYAGQDLTYKRLGNKYDNVWHEHEHYKLGKFYVEEGLRKGVFKKADNGTIITDLEAFGIPDTVLIKSDGTSLYITQDIALTKLKKDKYKADRLYWVIGPEQSLAMRQLFAVCEQLGIGKANEFTHIPFGLMTIKGSGKMSSRKGNVIYIDDLIDKAKDIIIESIKNPNINLEEREEIAEKLAVGAVKFSILKVQRLKDIAFDYRTSLSIHGDSGPYVVYTYVRTRAILGKLADQNNIKGDNRIGKNGVSGGIYKLELDKKERELIIKLHGFKSAIESACKDLAPSVIAIYLLELSQLFNTFYDKCRILNEEDKRKQSTRIEVVRNVGEIIKRGLSLLGIEIVERM